MIVCYISGGGPGSYMTQSEQSNYPVNYLHIDTEPLHARWKPELLAQGGSTSSWSQQSLAVWSHIHRSMEKVHTRLMQLGLYNYTYTLRYTVKDVWNSALHPCGV